MLYDIYVVTNLVNGKKYVGQTKQTVGVLARFEGHCRKAYSPRCGNNKFHNAIRAYGKENFSVKRILKNIPENKVDYYESLWICKLQTYKYGYNATLGGQGVHGYKHTAQTKILLSKKTKNFWVNVHNDTNLSKKMFISRSNALCGLRKTDMHKFHISESRKKLNLCKERNGFYGKHHKLETKKYLSECNSVPIIGISVRNKGVVEFSSIKLAAEWCISQRLTTNKDAASRICGCCQGKKYYKSAYGYIWKYK